MINKLSTIILLVIFPFLLSGQSFNIVWQNCFGGSNWDAAYDIIKVDDGYLLLGHTGSNDGDISHSNGGADIWVIKISEAGNLLWEKTYGGSKGDSGRRIFEAGEGNFYIIGVSDSSDGDITYDPYPNSLDLWLLKIDSEGNIIWEEIFGGTGWEMDPTGVATVDGGLVVLVLSSSGDGDISNHFGLWDAWMIKVNSDGEKEWDFTLGSPGQEFGQAIIQTSDGGFLVGISAQLFEGGNITCTPHNSDYTAAILVKLDADRNIEWDRCYGGSKSEAVNALAEVSDGYIMGAGTFSSDGDVSGNHGGSDIWIVKTDFEGNIIWQKCFGGSKGEDLKKMHIDEFENILIASVTSSTDGDISHNNSMSADYYDIWLFKINSQGDLLWEHCFGGINTEQLWFGFHYINENNFVMAGEMKYGPSYDVTCSPHGTNGLDKDIWVFEVKDTTVNVQNYKPLLAGLTAYPNPAKDYVIFEYSGTNAEMPSSMKIFNSIGMELSNPQIYSSGTRMVWDTREVKPGVYFCTFNLGEEFSTGKIIIE
jgi:hypothetical protein